jgi:hypothetical protein
MAELKLDKTVRRVTLLASAPSGAISTRVLQIQKRRGRRKGSALWRPQRRLVRRAARAMEIGAQDYLRRFDRSDRRRRDGWMRDHVINLQRAYWKAMNRLV